MQLTVTKPGQARKTQTSPPITCWAGMHTSSKC